MKHWPGMRWSKEIKARALELYKTKSSTKVAKELGIPQGTLWYWVHDAGIRKGQNWSQERKDKVYELRRKGWGYKSIARELGMSSPGQIQRYIKTLPVDPKPKVIIE